MILQATFFWRNDRPGGIGLSFGPPVFNPTQLDEMFAGDILKKYLRDSDEALGTRVVSDYLTQLTAIGAAKERGQEISLQESILAALNIIWLTERGIIPNDEFNGYQFIRTP